MTTTNDDLFDCADVQLFDVAEDEAGIERDRFGRPLILPDPAWSDTSDWRPAIHPKVLELRAQKLANLSASNGWPDGKVVRGQLADGRRPYTRISTMADHASPTYGLGIYLRRMEALALARMPDLAAMLCGLDYRHGQRIDLILQEALLRAKEHGIDPGGQLTAAALGTAFHQFTTPGMQPALDVYHHQTLTYVADHRRAADALAAELERLELDIVDSEQFVVNDDIRCAGTFDHLVRDLRTGTVHVLDKKKANDSSPWPDRYAQLDGYSGGKRYDPATGVRTPLHEDLSRDVGFIASVRMPSGSTHAEVRIVQCDLTDSPADHAAESHRRNSSDYVNARKVVRR